MSSQIDVLILGIWVNSSDIGIYAVARRLSNLALFVPLIFDIVIPPKYAVLYANKAHESLQNLVSSSAQLMTIAAIFVCTPFIFIPRLFLGIYGEQFVDGALVLVIISIGQFINVATGLMGRLLIMTGHEHLERTNTVGNFLLYLALNIALIPQYGILGAAIAVSIAVILKSIITSYLVWLKLDIFIWRLPRKGKSS
ncbi:MAG: polysaccharide biosynthesis C-terminal domain-containing protein [Chloroflexota bacterium]